MRMHPRVRSLCLLVVVVAAALFPAMAAAQTPGNDDVETLKRQIEELRQAYEQRLADLERRIAEMEGTPVSPAPPQTQEDREIEDLRAAAQAEAGQTPDAPSFTPQEAAPPIVRDVSVGSERNLNRLNPEISITGDAVGFVSRQGSEGSQRREDFDTRELELNLQSALDPYSFTKVTLSFSPEEGVDIEEALVAYTGLPGGLQLSAGKFRQNFGLINRWHLHALPQLDYPLALQSYFGDEGLAQTGLSATWLLPRPWATANELTLELTDGESDAFGGESFERLVGLVHLKNYWDLNAATYAELGFSGIQGGNGTGGDSRVLGTDFTLHWQPPQRAKYREVTWRTELLRSERDDEEGTGHQAWGGYSYIEGLVAQNLYAGVRYDRVEDPLAPEQVRWGLFPNLTWWQSEYVRLRGEYGYLKDDLTGDDENRFTLQIIFAAGPHKHETY